jgi:threonine dehydratase
MNPGIDEVKGAVKMVYRTMLPTPQISWPKLNARLGVEVWLKHENHTPAGAFKISSGLVYFEQLAQCR